MIVRLARALPPIGKRGSNLTRAGIEITRNASTQPNARIAWPTVGRISLGLLFSNNFNDCWQQAARLIGVDMQQLHNQAGHA